MKNILFITALFLIVGEVSAVIFYWDLILIKIKSNWWLSFLSLFGLFTRTLAWSILKAGFMSLIVEGVLSFVFKFKPIASKLEVMSTYKSKKVKQFMNYWGSETKYKKIVILAAYVPVLLITVGFILYTPFSKKIALNTAKKKGGGKLILFITKNLIKIEILYLTGKFLRRLIKKLSIKIIRFYRETKTKYIIKNEDTKAGIKSGFLL